MTLERKTTTSHDLVRVSPDALPSLVRRAGDRASRRFVEFFAATIRNKNTRMAYALAVSQFFRWCDSRGFQNLDEIEPLVVAAYVEQHPGAKPTVKQHLAAIRMLFDWLVTGQVVPHNPAASVRGPSHVVKRGRTPVLSAEQARELLDSIDLSTTIGLRDRALIGVMVYTFARVSAAVSMTAGDYYPEGKRWWIRLHEKGGKEHAVPAHHSLEAFLDSYVKAVGPIAVKGAPLFRTIDRQGAPTHRAMTRADALRMIKRRVRAIGLPRNTCCHTFRATGITAYLENGGTIENAQAIAAHESPRTTKLYDRTSDEITLDEIERILI
jgi:integrase/recombinase XerD